MHVLEGRVFLENPIGKMGGYFSAVLSSSAALPNIRRESDHHLEDRVLQE
jgi:hypothetical protein